MASTIIELIDTEYRGQDELWIVVDQNGSVTEVSKMELSDYKGSKININDANVDKSLPYVKWNLTTITHKVKSITINQS